MKHLEDQATQFLRDKELISKGFNHFIIDFPNDKEVNLGELLSEFAFKILKETEANAKLIAAAPELLEALKSFTDAVKNEDIVIYDNLDHDGFASTPNRIFTEAEKAIEKALK